MCHRRHGLTHIGDAFFHVVLLWEGLLEARFYKSASPMTHIGDASPITLHRRRWLPTRVSYDELEKKEEDRVYPYIHHIYTCFIHSLHKKFTCFTTVYITNAVLIYWTQTNPLCRNKNKKTYHSMPISAQSQVQEILFPFPLQLLWPTGTYDLFG